MTIFS